MKLGDLLYGNPKLRGKLSVQKHTKHGVFGLTEMPLEDMSHPVLVQGHPGIRKCRWLVGCYKPPGACSPYLLGDTGFTVGTQIPCQRLICKCVTLRS